MTIVIETRHAAHARKLNDAVLDSLTSNEKEPYRWPENTRFARPESALPGVVGPRTSYSSGKATADEQVQKARAAGKAWLCGYVFRLAGKSGAKGLHASEGYGISSAAEAKPAWCVIHAFIAALNGPTVRRSPAESPSPPAAPTDRGNPSRD